MKIAASILLLAVAATTPHHLRAQQHPQPFTDPANLGGERITPLNGHELPIDQGTLGLAQLLRKLSTRASILNIVAHPDDEDGGMLTLYARGFGARVADLALTRGEGGQNFVTGDFEDALGLIRTQELLANDRYTGVTQMFGTEVDFGFSKTREESFQKWGHDRVLYDVVRAIRIYRPLVITATFIGNVTDGHGQHQVSGEIAQEAFKAAADPNVFPDMIREGILPWQALKIYARVPFAQVNSKGVYDYATDEYVPARFTNYVTGKVSTTKPNADIEVPEGDPDPLLTAAAANPKDIPSTLAANPSEQLSYMQFARIGLGLQRTQISKDMRLPTSGPHNSGYTLYGSVLCNAPTDARAPNITTQTCHPEQAQRAERPTVHPTSRNAVTLSESTRGPIVSIPAERLAVHPTTQNAVILSGADRASASSAAEGPATRPAATMQLASFHPNSTSGPATNLSSQPDAFSTTTPSSRPERSAVERSVYLNSADTPHDLTTQPTFFTGIDTTIEGIATLAPNAPPTLRTQLATIATNIAKATQNFNPNNPSAIAPPLAAALHTDDALIDQLSKSPLDPIQKANVLHELSIKRVQLNDALTLALGLRINATASSANIVTNTTASIHTVLTTTGEQSIPYSTEELKAYLSGEQKTSTVHLTRLQIDGNQVITSSRPWTANLPASPAMTPIETQPYFYRDNIEQPVYKLRNPALRNAPQTPAPLTAWATVTYQGTEVTLARIVHDGPQPVSIIPPVSISSAPSATVLPTGQPTAQLTATLTTEANTSANINVQSPHNWTIQAKAIPAPATDPTHSINFYLHPTATVTDPAIFHLTATTPDHYAYTEGWRPVGYPGLILTNYYTPATTRVIPVDLKLPTHDRIAYLPGTGDAVPQALASIGLTPTLITVADLTPAKLSSFDTVVLGVRTYSAHPDLHGAPTTALLNFARNGGNVVVQYQTSDFTSADAPYPLNLGNAAKVVVETDPVELLTSTNPLLTTPNKITTADFNNWIEERGHGFLESWDPHYTALTETHDPGGDGTLPQPPQRGGLITAQVGKGRWTYVAFAVYRQLPEAVPGAYRLFVNLIIPPTH